MKDFYPENKGKYYVVFTRTVFVLFFAAILIPRQSSAQELVFNNVSLESGSAGSNGAVYRFSNVTSGVDALLTIAARSDNNVSLLDIDITNTGHDKAFQPKVTYGRNNSSPRDRDFDWWMEFQISFVKSGSNAIVPVDSFNLTALDIDGNSDKIREWVSMYNCQSFTLESPTKLNAVSIMESVGGIQTVVGKQFIGPVQNFTDIDTSATSVMVTSHYEHANSFRIRAGAHSTGSSGAADRLYSFWFKSFGYQKPSESTLPLLLESFNAILDNNKVNLKWTTSHEVELSHFTIERSTNGVEYKEVGLVFASGDAGLRTNYSFDDKLPVETKAVIYYRLRMVDVDGKYQYSPVQLIRLGGAEENSKILAYPNPVKTALRVTLPKEWQNQTVTFELYNGSGQVIRRLVSNGASQTELINVQDLNTGIYLLKTTCGNAFSLERIIKSK